MNELRDLYQEVILDHNRRPRNFGGLPNANREAEVDALVQGVGRTIELFRGGAA